MGELETLNQVDDLMAELGLAGDSGSGGGAGGPTEDEIDALLAETTGMPVGGSASAGPGAMSAGPGAMSAGPGAMSSGPGAMSAGPGAMSAGPGGMSMGPGGMSMGPGGMSMGPGASGMARGTIAGPGAGMQKMSGPGVGLTRNEDGQLTKTTPDGRTAVFNGPPCATCGEPVIGKVISALGKSYHPECFVCVACNKPFPNGEFTEHEEEPYCDDCYDNLMAPTCNNCGQPVLDQCIRAFGKYYHPNHFTCSGCGTALAGKKYKEDEGEPFCLSCKEQNKKLVLPEAGICARCKEPIVGDFITLNGQRMHPYHFQCEECGAAFTGGNCHEYEGKLYCHTDYLKLLRETCGGCHKPIIGRSITAMGKVWHPEHFVCFICKEPFAGSAYREHGGNAYCELHYHQQFGNACAKCNKVCQGATVTFGGKTFHPDCFQCTGCERPLKDIDYINVETNPYCKKCFKKLPKDIRKRIMDKRKAEQKANKKLNG